jgi:DNA-binding GntR family transcriptional regulator
MATPQKSPVSPFRRNLAEVVTAQLRDAIVSGRIQPGTPLAEPVLAAEFGASRAPIREALIALEREGLVEFNDRSRTRVRSLTARDFEEICSMRIALESLAARLAASKWTAHYSQAVEENLGRQERAGTLGELSRLDVELHASVVNLTGHRRLIASWQGIRWQFEMCLAYTHRLQQTLAFEPRRITVDSHRRLLAALASGDPDLAARTMASHIEGSLEWSLAEFPAEAPDSTRDAEILRRKPSRNSPAKLARRTRTIAA